MPDWSSARSGSAPTGALAVHTKKSTDAQDVLVPRMELRTALKGLRIHTQTTLNAEVWESALSDLGLKRKYPTLVHSIRFGFHIGIPSIQHSFTPSNKLHDPISKAAFAQVMENELHLGRWLSPFSCQEIESEIGPFQTSPISMLSKTGKPGKFRLLQNLSYPYKPLIISSHIPTPISSINSHIDSTLYPCYWGTFANTCRLIWTLPPGSQGAVRDISEAYRMLPIHPSQLPGAVIRAGTQDEFCIDTRVMFGLSSSGGTFGHLADGGMEICRGRGLGPLTKWVDDHLWLRILRKYLEQYNKLRAELSRRVQQTGGLHHSRGRLYHLGNTLPNGRQEEFNDDFTFPIRDLSSLSPRSPEDAAFTYAFHDIDQITLPLGYRWALDKDILFGVEPLYFGFLWHLESMRVSVPASKREKYLEEIRKWSESQTHDSEQVRKLYGKLLHVSLILPIGRAYLVELEKFEAELSHTALLMKHHAPRGWHEDMIWWIKRLSAPISSPIPGPANLVDVGAYSDASSGYGISLYIRSYWRAYRLLPGWRGPHNERDIGWAEAVGFLFLIIIVASRATQHQHYKFWGDNNGVIEGWWSGRSRNRSTNSIFKSIHKITTEFEFHAHTRYIPSAENPADPFSRGHVGPDSGILPSYPIAP